MTRLLTSLAAVLALAACGTVAGIPSTGAGLEASGARLNSPTPGAGTSGTSGAPVYGVLVDQLSDPKTYTISVVSPNGQVVASVKAARRTLPPNAHGQPLELPYVNASQWHLYYLDGDQAVREVLLDGRSEPVTQLGVAPGSELVFAVSPDDAQIAVSVIDFTRSPAHVLLYTQPMPSGNRHVIFESDTDYVWPVAWRGAQLVLAHAYGAYVEDALKAAPGQDNPYWAISYHVIDPSTAVRATLMGACTVSGPLSPSGSACIQGGTIDWSGGVTDWSTNDWGSISSAASLSPDGSLVAAAKPDNDRQLAFWRKGGTIATWVDGPGSREWAGWLDDTHVLVASSSADFEPRIITLSPGPSPAIFVNAKGFYAARFPTDIF
jgi:hypothetical protein